MNLQVVNYPTPQGKTCDVVDADRDGGEGRPLIVARFFEPEYAKAFVALPGLLAAAKAMASAYSGLHWEGKRIDPNVVADLMQAVEVAEAK
jgi:hypothetical protein